MRHLRRYIATKYKGRMLTINNCEITETNSVRIAMHDILVFMDATKNLNYMCHRKSYCVWRLGCKQMRLINFVYPYIKVYDDDGFRFYITMDNDRMVFVDKNGLCIYLK